MGIKVKKGDGWYTIAKREGVDVNELLKANNATLDTMIHPDTVLKRPGYTNPMLTNGFPSKSSNYFG